MAKQEKKNKAYNSYMGKIKLLGCERDLIDNLFTAEWDGTITVDIFRLAIIQDFPKRLHIPSFVDYIKDIDETDPSFENNIQKIQYIYIPDTVKMKATTYKILNKFEGLKSVSISTRQFILLKEICYDLDIRIPEEAEMVVTDKTKALMDLLVSRHTSESSKLTGSNLFIAFEVASRATSEETVLAALGLFAIENDLCNTGELADYVGKNISNSIIELLEQQDKSGWHKAKVIKHYPWLMDAYNLKVGVEEKYDIEDTSKISYHLTYPGDKMFDIGQTFKKDIITVDKDVEYGFYGNGDLGYFKYLIIGNVTPSLALEIIRLTSDYEMVNSELEGLNRPGYNKLHLDFYEQHWFNTIYGESTGWTYPNGRIQAQGYRGGISLSDILLESCFLAASFKKLKMQVTLISQQPNTEQDCIIIYILDGKVTASVEKDYFAMNTWEPDEEYIIRINKLLSEGHIGLSQDEIKTINQRNKLDYEAEDIQEQEELSRMLCGLDIDLAYRLSKYIEETTGMSLYTSSSRNCPSYQMLKLLFNFDMDKLKGYIKDRMKGR